MGLDMKFTFYVRNKGVSRSEKESVHFSAVAGGFKTLAIC